MPIACANRRILVPLIAEVVGTRTQRAWLDALERAGVPCGPINTIDKVFDDPHVIARGMKFAMPHPQAGTVPQVGNPLKLSATTRRVSARAAVARRAHGDGIARAPGPHRCDARRSRRGRRDRRACCGWRAALSAWVRKPAFWVGYVAVALAALAIAWQLFPLAIPLVNLDIKLGRDEAMARAIARGEQLALTPAGARVASRFTNDQALQNYVELEGGGKPAFAALVEGSAYAPYWWEVRLFAPGEVNEATVRFRPDGSINGFTKSSPRAGCRPTPLAPRSIRRSRASLPNRARKATGASTSRLTRR
jgi:hypothetical protein